MKIIGMKKDFNENLVGIHTIIISLIIKLKLFTFIDGFFILILLEISREFYYLVKP